MARMLGPNFRTHHAALALAFLLTLLTATVARADSLTLAWDANPEPDVVGYYVFIGTTSGVYSTVVDVGSATSYTYTSAVPGTTYYLTVAAYVAGPVIGPHAPEVVTTIGGGPTLSNPGNRTNSRGDSVSLTLSASDPNNDPITFGAYGLPTGLSLNPTTGIISGSPTTAGAFNVAVTASDPSANVTTQYFVWTIVASDTTAPVIAITSPTSTSTYSTSSAFITLTGSASDDVGVTTVTWANSRGGSGTAAGTTNWSVVIPLQSGSNVLTMTARDATDKSASVVLTVTVDLAPSVTIASPTSASTYNTTTATLSLSGTASDDVSVAAVTWSNSRGGSGTAIGTTSWSVSGISLQSGTNVLTITARDSGGRTSTATLSVSYAAPALQLTGLTANKTAPQTAGTTVTFTATASGGSAPYQYKWWLFDGGSWSILQGWSASSTFAWTPTSANAAYKIGVWVRSADRIADSSDNDNSNRSIDFPISEAVNPLSVTSLTSDKASPQFVATAIRFTTAARGGTAPYEFKWRVFDGAAWTVIRDWNSSAALTWTPTVPGSAYQVQVWARSAGSTTDAAENANATATLAFVVHPTPTAELTLTSLTSDKAAPQPPSTTITFTASASGGTAPYQYKWWLFDGTTWAVEQDWSTSNTFRWTPAKANSAYRLGVWVRSANVSANTSDNDDSNRSISFPIVSVSPALSLTGFTMDKPSPQLVSTAIRFAASTSGGTAPSSFKFRVFNGTSWSVLRDWSTTDNVTWTPGVAGTYQVEVWARSSSNATDAAENGASASRAFTITNAPTSSATLALTGISVDKAAPQIAGTTITLTASATGGTGPYSYKWWLFDGVTWDVLQGWSASASVAWTPSRANSNYRIGVWIRSAGSARDSSDNADSNGSVAFPITAGATPLAVTNLISDRPSPQAAGTPITFTASASGGTGPYSFKWRVFDGSSWIVAQTWSPSASFVWTPTVQGSAYRIEVWARSAGRTADEPDNSQSSFARSYTISYSPTSPLRLLSLAGDKASPLSVGTPVTVTATTTGGVPQYQYKWWLFDGQQWIVLKSWSTSSSFTWTPTAPGSNYRIGVWVRSSTNSFDMSDNDASNGSVLLPVQ